MRRWLVLIVMVAAVSSLFAVARLPTPLLFGGLVGALVYALMRPQAPLRLPDSWFQAGQAVIGVIVGASMDWRGLGTLGPRWLVVVGVSCFSLIVSVLVGRLLIRRGATPVTATFASVAGGAAGLTAMADDLGADARVVAVLQYLRLLVVLVTMPLVVTLVFGVRSDGVALAGTGTNWWVDVPFAVSAVVGGLLAGRRLRLPAAAILGPLLVAALMKLLPFLEHAAVPPAIEALGYLVIGVQVGLKFTAASVRAIGRMLPTALLTVVVTLLACAGLGWVLTVTTDASPLDAYLATTPGGIYGVLGVSAATGGDVGFVAAAQMLRLLIVLASAPLIGAYLRRT
ncbi:AbrB family transcriptional regulator [Mycolicibacterium sp. CBM1]